MSQPRGIPTNHRGGHNMHPSMGTSPQTQQMHYSPQTHPYLIANMPGTPMVSNDNKIYEVAPCQYSSKYPKGCRHSCRQFNTAFYKCLQ